MIILVTIVDTKNILRCCVELNCIDKKKKFKEATAKSLRLG